MRTLVLYLAFSALVFSAQVFGQGRASRITKQDAYRNWRLVDPNLEADAANNPGGPGAPSLRARAERVASEAAKYFAERKAYYQALAAEMRAASKNMEPAAAPTSAAVAQAQPPSGVNIQAQLNAIAANLSAIPKNPDAGLTELRRALERERAALTAIKDLPGPPANSSSASATPAASNAHAREDYADLLAEVEQESVESDKLGEAWASYYRALAEGAAGIGTVRSTAIRPRPADPRVEPTDAALLTPAAPPATQPTDQSPREQTPPARERLAEVIAGKSPTSPTPGAPRAVPVATPAASPANVPAAERPLDRPNDRPNEHAGEAAFSGPARSTSAVSAPVSRYAGGWVYPTIGEHYHGAHPESVDLDIRAENGHVTGKFRTKFRIPAGVTLDPIVEFTFEGDYQASRSQTFPYVTPDGTKGTIELIPATTFNLLEISFVSELAAEAKTNKITRGNFFLIRK